MQQPQLCVSLYNYNATKPDELSLKPGSIVKIMKKADDGWNFGICQQQHGWFPSNFVTVPEDINLADCQQLRYGRALYDYSPQEPDELQLKLNDFITILDTVEDQGWFRGIINGKLGLFPENFIRIVTDVGEEKQLKQKDIIPGNRRSSLAPNEAMKLIDTELRPKLCTAIVTFDYVSQQQDELQLKKGQVLDVLEKQEDGWWTGRDAVGKVGVFPYNFVRELMSMEERQQITTNKLVTKAQASQLTDKAKSQPPQTSPKPSFLKAVTNPEIGKLPPLTKNRVSLQARKRAPSVGTKGIVNEVKEQHQQPVQQQNSLENTLVAPEERSLDVTLYQLPSEPIPQVQLAVTQVNSPVIQSDSANVTMIQEGIWIDPKEDEGEEDYIANYASNMSLNGLNGVISQNSNMLKPNDANSVSKATLVSNTPDKTLIFDNNTEGITTLKDSGLDDYESIRNYVNMELNNIRVQFETALMKERDQRILLQKEVQELERRLGAHL